MHIKTICTKKEQGMIHDILNNVHVRLQKCTFICIRMLHLLLLIIKLNNTTSFIYKQYNMLSAFK